MSYIRMQCFSCNCLFDPEHNYAIDGMEQYNECPQCGQRFLAPTRCPKCGSTDVDEDNCDPMCTCNSCGKSWDQMENDDYWGDTLAPVACPKCGVLNDISKCTGNLPDDDLKSCDSGNFICGKCKNQWPTKEYWQVIWSK